jgi:hypothetical protein
MPFEFIRKEGETIEKYKARLEKDIETSKENEYTLFLFYLLIN